MTYLWKILRSTMCVTGIICIFGAVGTSDLYNLELGKPEPPNVEFWILMGVLLMVPTIIHMIREQRKGDV